MTDKNATVSLRYVGILSALIACALLLAARLCYLFLAEPSRFPINTVKVAASYQHVTHKELESVLSNYLEGSFFTLPVTRLQQALGSLEWVENASVERVWPDVLKIKLVEKKPIAYWGDGLLSDNGRYFKSSVSLLDSSLPKLNGPPGLEGEVLQVYQKLSKILSDYGLFADGLQMRDNGSWLLTLLDNVKIHLGKKELEQRLLRFCKAYPAVFAEKISQLKSVDLRYPHGMAVQWKQQTER